MTTTPESHSMSCGFCGTSLDTLSILEREEHYELHFQNGVEVHATEMKTIAKSGSTADSDNREPRKATKPWTRKRLWNLKENDDFWHPSQATPPPHNFTPGLIPLLKKVLLKAHATGNLRRAALCYEQAVHVSTEFWDSRWGCGYRNFIMASITLIEQQLQPKYHSLLTSPLLPGIRNLQTWIEAAWATGFDEDGAKDLKKLVGTSKWLGTADLWVAYSFSGIPAELVDFNLTSHPQGVEVVTNWVVDYFTPTKSSSTSTNIHEVLRGATPVISTNLLPLILQHNGHSRTIVGYEIDKKGTVNLLTFDPAKIIPASVRNAILEELFGPKAKKWPSMRSSTVQFTVQQYPTSSKRRKLMNSREEKSRPESSSHAIIDLDDDDDVIIVEEAQVKAQNSVNTSANAKGTQVKSEDKKETEGPHSDKLLSPSLLKRFRLDPKSLGKQKAYQILYFPMTQPLTETERMRRKVVTSTKIC